MKIVECIDVVMKKVKKATLGYVSKHFYFEEFKKNEHRERESETT